MAKTIDINCDLGEGIGNEALLMPYISSCNIACGGHAGDKVTMSHIIDLALDYKVRIGAHPSFPDKKNFGRKVLDMSSLELYESIRNQIENLNSILVKKNVPLSHIKPHGALYNMAVKDESIAEIIVEVVKSFDKNLTLYVPYQSIIEKKATENEVAIKFEVFADRNYNDDLTLVSRQNKNALIHDSSDMFEHVYEMIVNKKVNTINGVGKPIKVDTICVHGDAKNVVRNLRFLVQKLSLNNIDINSCI